LKIYFLGTGTSQGIPVIGSNHPVCLSEDFRDKRLRVSVWVTWQEGSVVIDCGPDFRQQMLASGCSHIDALLMTHEHADHTAGLDDIRPFNFRQGALPMYALPRVHENLNRRFDYIFAVEDRYPGAPSIKSIPVDPDKPFEVCGMRVIPILVMHGNLDILGYRIGNFAYLTDVKTLPDSEMGKLKGVEVLVVNALREEPHETHFNLSEALAFVELISPLRTYLTHISHKMGFHSQVSQSLPPNVFLAYDNLEISIP
jgi:phosphoribosyl 1,2-cyclic phosphate phosphodiesterase